LKIQASLLSKPDEQNDDEKQDSNSDAEKTEVEDNSSLKEENKTDNSVVISKHGDGKTDKISVVRRGRKRLNLNGQSKVILAHDSSLREGIISNENPQLKAEVLVDVVSPQQDGRSKEEEKIRLDQSLKKESKAFQTKSNNFEKQKSDQEQQKPPQRANLPQQPLLQSTVEQKVASGPKISTAPSTSTTATTNPFPTTTSESAPAAQQQEKVQSEPKASTPTKSPNKNLESSDSKK
jgi:hypothetical protein